MIVALLAVTLGLLLLIWSAGRFVEGAAATARHCGMPPLLIGMLVIGFGTSAPEIVVSVLSASQGNPGLALGNAFGSNIANIGLILGLTALISPIVVESGILRRELPLLAFVTGVTALLLSDHNLSRLDAWYLLALFGGVMAWMIHQGVANPSGPLAEEFEPKLAAPALPLRSAITWLVVGLLMLTASSRLLVWGAISIATALGVSDLIIGLTIVALGTSLPELASSLIAVRRGEHDIAFGNVLGSNLFNTLAVVGIAGAIQPTGVAPEVLSRDILVMGCLTITLFFFGYGFGGRPARISRSEGAILLGAFLTYNVYLMLIVAGQAP